MTQLPYQFAGRVVHGAGRGRTLGFPTANLDVQLPVALELGIYAGWVWITDRARRLPAVIYWGSRPTFAGHVPVCEVFVIDTVDDLYGTQIKGELTSFIRPDQQFESADELTRQMHQDVAEARRRLATTATKTE